MKKAVFLLGIIYLIWGIFQTFSSIFLIKLFRDFAVPLPIAALVLPPFLFIFAIILFFSFYLKLKNQWIYKLLFVLGLVFMISAYLFIFFAANKANGIIEGLKIYPKM